MAYLQYVDRALALLLRSGKGRAAHVIGIDKDLEASRLIEGLAVGSGPHAASIA